MNRNWEAKDGTKKNRTDVIMENMQMGPRGGWYGDSGNPPASPSASQGGSDSQAGKAGKEELETIEYPNDDINPDEIPF